MTTLKKIDFGTNQGGSVGNNMLMPGSVNRSARSHLSVDISDNQSVSSVSSSGRALGKFKDFATMAVSVTTGKKLNLPSKERGKLCDYWIWLCSHGSF